jgi:hypothetical protein
VNILTQDTLIGVLQHLVGGKERKIIATCACSLSSLSSVCQSEIEQFLNGGIWQRTIIDQAISWSSFIAVAILHEAMSCRSIHKHQREIQALW